MCSSSGLLSILVGLIFAVFGCSSAYARKVCSIEIILVLSSISVYNLAISCKEIQIIFSELFVLLELVS